eukprot:scaffold84727_cov72-Phaeocystis_antarctica.AAC.2
MTHVHAPQPNGTTAHTSHSMHGLTTREANACGPRRGPHAAILGGGGEGGGSPGEVGLAACKLLCADRGRIGRPRVGYLQPSLQVAHEGAQRAVEVIHDVLVAQVERVTTAGELDGAHRVRRRDIIGHAEGGDGAAVGIEQVTVLGQNGDVTAQAQRLGIELVQLIEKHRVRRGVVPPEGIFLGVERGRLLARLVEVLRQVPEEAGRGGGGDAKVLQSLLHELHLQRAPSARHTRKQDGVPARHPCWYRVRVLILGPHADRVLRRIRRRGFLRRGGSGGGLHADYLLLLDPLCADLSRTFLGAVLEVLEWLPPRRLHLGHHGGDGTPGTGRDVAAATGEVGLLWQGVSLLALQRARAQASVRAQRDIRLGDEPRRIDKGLIPLLLARDRGMPLITPPCALRLRRRPEALEARRRPLLVPDGGALCARAHAFGRALSRAISRPEARRAAAVAEAVRAARERGGAREAADRHALGLEHAVQHRLRVVREARVAVKLDAARLLQHRQHLARLEHAVARQILVGERPRHRGVPIVHAKVVARALRDPHAVLGQQVHGRVIHHPPQLAAAPDDPVVRLAALGLGSLHHVEAALLPHVDGQRVRAVHRILRGRVARSRRYGASERHVLVCERLQVRTELLGREIVHGRLCEEARVQLVDHATQHRVPGFGRVQEEVGAKRI